MNTKLEYVQVLLKNRRNYQLCWIPTLYAVKGKRITLKGDYNGAWEVKEVYTSAYEAIDENGHICDTDRDLQTGKPKKVIWQSKVEPLLSGDKLQERLSQYRKSKKLVNIEECD